MAIFLKRLTVGRAPSPALYIAENSSTVFYSTHVGCGPREAMAMIGRFDQHLVRAQRSSNVTRISRRSYRAAETTPFTS